jgi:capsular polysaccharide biosynthesis protein
MSQQIRLNPYFLVVWRAKWIILAVTVQAALLAVLIGMRQADLYTATALLEVGKVWKEPLEDPYLTVEIINSDGFIQRLAEKMGAKQSQLKRQLRAEAVTGGAPRSAYAVLVKITASAENPEEAVKLAQAAAEETIKRHLSIFDGAMESHLERQRWLEEQKQELAASRAALSQAAVSLVRDLDEVKSANSSPTMTKRSNLITPVVAGPRSRAPVARNALVAALIAAATASAVAILVNPSQAADGKDTSS